MELEEWYVQVLWERIYASHWVAANIANWCSVCVGMAIILLILDDLGIRICPCLTTAQTHRHAPLTSKYSSHIMGRIPTPARPHLLGVHVKHGVSGCTIPVY